MFAPRATLSREKGLPMERDRVRVCCRERDAAFGRRGLWEEPMALTSVVEGLESQIGSVNIIEP